MRILTNENFPGDAVVVLRQHGHDVVWIRTDALGSNDVEVLARAQREERIVITFDKDFGSWLSAPVYPLRVASSCSAFRPLHRHTWHEWPSLHWRAGLIGQATLPWSKIAASA